MGSARASVVGLGSVYTTFSSDKIIFKTTPFFEPVVIFAELPATTKLVPETKRTSVFNNRPKIQLFIFIENWNNFLQNPLKFQRNWGRAFQIYSLFFDGDDWGSHQQSGISQLFRFGLPAPVAGLIVGIEHKQAHIYQIDERGNIYSFDDAGFAAIGIGAGHARLSLAQSRYTNATAFTTALAAVYAAKKAAETAPGVGSNTDIQLVSREGITTIAGDLLQKLEEMYLQYTTEREALADKTVTALDRVLDEERKKINEAFKSSGQGGESSSGGNTENNKGS
jgi:hypothetical protein